MRSINRDKCIGCGRCVEDCVNRFLRLCQDGFGKMHSDFVERGRCIECGHCNAICPSGAITGGKCLEPDLPKDSLLSLMAGKRTARRYVKEGVISREDLERIVLAGQSAPTNRNRKAGKILFVKEKLPELYEIALDYLVKNVMETGTINPLYVPTMRMNNNRNEILWNAEYLVVLAGSSQNIIDAAIAAERMQLEAEELGLGTAYRGDMVNAINGEERLHELLELKSNEEALVSFTLGVTDLNYLRPSVKENRKVISM